MQKSVTMSNRGESRMKGFINRTALRFSTKKENGGKEIIMEILLVAIAIALGIAWKTGLGAVITNMIADFTTRIGSLFS